jgi:hypothetical protein
MIWGFWLKQKKNFEEKNWEQIVWETKEETEKLIKKLLEIA